LLPVFCRFYAACLIAVLPMVLSVGTAAGAAGGVDSAALAAVGAAQAGDWAKAYAEASQSRDGMALPLVRWLDFTRTAADGRFAEISGFIATHPDWPLQKTLERRAEAALATQSDDTAAAWFKDHPPVSGPALARAAEIMLADGQVFAGTAALRAAWIDGDFAASDERALLARYGALLRPEDHQRRLERLLWDGQDEAARRMLPLVAADYRALAEGRLAVAGDAGNAGNLVARLPASFGTDPGLAYDEAVWWHKKGNFDNAAQLLLAHPDNPVRPAMWWKERLLVARHLLARGNADTAYQLVRQQAASLDGDSTACDAEFLSGFIALDFRNDPALAFEDFARILGRVASPYAKARAAYWAGRAATAAGKPDLAAKWYAVSAANMATFYGQLSAQKLGKNAPPHPAPEPRPDAAQQAGFDAAPLVGATELLFDAGDRLHAGTFLMKMAETATTELDFAMLASLAESHGRTDLAIAVARRAIDAGIPLMMHGYPVTALPAGGGTAERPLLLAIVRQESAFAPDAMSSVGARGLMQLMPATAQRVAGKLQLPYSPARLGTDGVYNITLGRSYIETLLDDFGGSYPLAIAAYNAGPGRVNEWLRDFGDPRGNAIGMVDWIEMIPFNETRNYVQRVLENLQIYRGQAGDTAAAFSLAADLAR
jgi:soluble lytic murein transglycosylase